MLFEHPLKMRLIGKPCFQRDIGDQLAAAQLIAGELDAPVDQKRVGRLSTLSLCFRKRGPWVTCFAFLA